MVSNKVLVSSVKKEKKKFNKNVSFSGVESKKSPKNRRKSIGAILPTPLKKKKKENISIPNEWQVTDSIKNATIKKKQLVVTDSKEEENLVVTSTPLTRTRKIKTKKHEESQSTKKKKSINNIENPLPNIDSSAILKDKKKKKEQLNDTLDTSEVEESEEKFGIKSKETAEAIKAVIKLRLENPKLQNQLFEEPIPLFLNISCHKVPRGPSRIIRVPLPNSILTPDDEVCLIVPEVKGIKNIEHEKHLEHYENLLRKKGVQNIKKIMTFHQFRTEYETYEQKLRLADLYDMFLVDGRISGKVVKKCGKIFYKKRKVPTSVKLQATKLKEHIDKALCKAFLLLHLKGDSYSVQFGHNKMPIQDLVENVFAVIESLNKEFPGGFPNIKGLHVTTMRASSIPIYSSFTFPKEVKTPQVRPKKPKVYKTFTDELTTLPNAEVKVLPTGRVLVKRTQEVDENAVQAKNGKKKVKRTKKRKQVELVSGETNGNDEKSNDNMVKKKRRKMDVEGKQDNAENSSENIKSNEETIKKAKVKNEKTTKNKKKEVKENSIEKNKEKKIKKIKKS